MVPLRTIHLSCVLTVFSGGPHCLWCPKIRWSSPLCASITLKINKNRIEGRKLWSLEVGEGLFLQTFFDQTVHSLFSHQTLNLKMAPILSPQSLPYTKYQKRLALFSLSISLSLSRVVHDKILWTKIGFAWKVDCALSKWKVNSVQSTVHTKHNLKKESPSPQPPKTHKKKWEAPSLHDTTSHWLHGKSVPKIGLPLFLAWTNSPP